MTRSSLDEWLVEWIVKDDFYCKWLLFWTCRVQSNILVDRASLSEHFDIKKTSWKVPDCHFSLLKWKYRKTPSTVTQFTVWLMTMHSWFPNCTHSLWTVWNRFHELMDDTTRIMSCTMAVSVRKGQRTRQESIQDKMCILTLDLQRGKWGPIYSKRGVKGARFGSVGLHF